MDVPLHILYIYIYIYVYIYIYINVNMCVLHICILDVALESVVSALLCTPRYTQHMHLLYPLYCTHTQHMHIDNISYLVQS